MADPDESVNTGKHALERALYLLLFRDARSVDVFAAQGRLLTDARPAGTGRTWWVQPLPEGDGVLGYISLHPPEFRIAPPTDPDDHLIPLPLSDQRPIRGRVERMLAALDAREMDEEEAGLANRLKNVLARTDEDDQALVAEFWNDVTGHAGQGATGPELGRPLYAKYFRHMSLPYFSACVALLDVGLRVGIRAGTLGDTTVVDPLSAFLVNQPDQRGEILAAGAETANRHYSEAKKALAAALASVSLRRFHHLLFWADHHYLIAHVLARNAELASSGLLHFDAYVAEEGNAVCGTGLFFGFEEFVDGRDTALLTSLVQALQADDEAEARRLVRTASSPRNPVLPKFWARLEHARAMLRAGGPWTGRAVELLLELERECSDAPAAGKYTDTGEEQLRVHRSLVNAFRTLGDHDAAERYASRMVGMMLIRSVLG